MDREALDAALRDRRPDESIATVVERWLLEALRASGSQLGRLAGVSIDSIDLDGKYPETRIVTRFRLSDGDDGRLVGFRDELWFTDEDGEPLEGESLIQAVRAQPFDMLFLSSLIAATDHLRRSASLAPRRVERDEATGLDVEWIDLPISDLYDTPELAALATRDDEQVVVVSSLRDAGRATVVIDGPWNRPQTIVCEEEDGRWRVASL